MPRNTDRDGLPGAGWGFPVETDHKGDIDLSTGETNIKESIRVIVGTAKGERPMRPEFGCEVHEHVFDQVNGTTLSLIETCVEDALIEWEQRIDVEDVVARRDEQEPNRIAIEIQYRLRATDAEGNMVYPFYLDR